MAPHSGTLAWKIPWMEEPGRLQSMGLLRVGLSDFTFTFHFHALEKEMATHSSVLAWRIPGMGKPGDLLSMGLHRVGHDWSDLATAAAAASSDEYSGWFSLGLTDWSCNPKDSQECSSTPQFRSINSLEASILWHSAFFIVQLSHSYMTTGKTMALTIWQSNVSAFENAV